MPTSPHQADSQLAEAMIDPPVRTSSTEAVDVAATADRVSTASAVTAISRSSNAAASLSPRAPFLTSADVTATVDGALRSNRTAVGGGASGDDSDGLTHRTVSPSTTNDEFPSYYLCPLLLNEPPTQGAYFDIPGANGELSRQVFEYSRLYRYIATTGTGRSVRSVSHPMNRSFVRRLDALALVRRVSPELQEIFNQERSCRGLAVDDDEPLGSGDTELYNQTMAQMRDT